MPESDAYQTEERGQCQIGNRRNQRKACQTQNHQEVDRYGFKPVHLHTEKVDLPLKRG